jgi:hypothetical protein
MKIICIHVYESMKTTVIILTVFCVNCYSFSQKLCTYCNDPFEGFPGYCISFPNKIDYFIRIDLDDGDHNIFGYTVSYGEYERRNHKIRLKDSFWGYDIELSVPCEDTVKVNDRSFKFLIHRNLALMNISYWNEEMHKKWFNEVLSKKENVNEYKTRTKNVNYFLRYGLYESPYNTIIENYTEIIEEHHAHELLIEESKYVFSFRQVVISEGTWSRDGNILRLH